MFRQANELWKRTEWQLLLLLSSHAFFSAQAQSSDVYQRSITIEDNWQFCQADEQIWRPAQVPGTVHTDLLANGVIEDPYYRTNERDQQWIDKKDWIYRTTFEVEEAWLRQDCIDLQFNGLDTYADVYLNDSLLLKADNFFVAWRKSVKDKLRPGTNELRIYFHSPTNVGLEKLYAHGYGLPAVNDQSENGGMGGAKVSVFTRKPGYHYGWDWGPRLVTSGIWRPVVLEIWDAARLEEVYFHQEELTEERAKLQAQVQIEVAQARNGRLLLYSGEELLAEKAVGLQPGRQRENLEVVIENPELWWSWDLGEPHLYDLRTVLELDGQTVDTDEQKIGLRTIRVVQQPDEKGSSFYFELNGVPLFAKGANYIPNDVFIPRVTKAQYARVLGSAVAANMNMVRVWGGGFYEEDIFYDLCDEMGLLVWQDFMFACSMYPGDEDFLAKVREEAEYNVRRLRRHPSIALWCGNNEIDVAWAQHKEFQGWGWKQLYGQKRREEIWTAYDRIFNQILPGVVSELSPQTFYWPSSPYNKEGEHAGNNTPNGDIHYWGVWHGKEPFSAFYDNIGRFMSEYGFQSFPEFETVKKYTLPEDWDIESEVMSAHQRSGIGNLRIRSYMKDHYRVPRRFEDMLYIGQLLQAEGMKMAIEAHRTAKPYCMGSLYWQLNDCWPVASWSGMDYYQNWKAMHYFVKKAFAPVMLAFRCENGQLNLQAVSDRREPVEATLQLELLDFSGQLLWRQVNSLQLDADASQRIGEWPEKMLTRKGNARKMVLSAKLVENGQTIAASQYYFRDVKKLRLPKKAPIQSRITELDDGAYQIWLRSDQLAKNVFLQVENTPGFFSDNYFDLLPGEAVEVIFKPKTPGVALTVERFRIRTVGETY